ncbi:Hypothetical protein FKW44_010352, partial [Caligus rogercresseyi]
LSSSHEARFHSEEQIPAPTCSVCMTILPKPEENPSMVKAHAVLHPPQLNSSQRLSI